MKSGAKQYVRACRNMLPFYGKKERTFIKKLADDLDQEKDYATICEEAGNPKDTAMAYLENCDEDYLIKKAFKRSLLKKLLLLQPADISNSNYQISVKELLKAKS